MKVKSNKQKLIDWSLPNNTPDETNEFLTNVNVHSNTTID